MANLEKSLFIDKAIPPRKELAQARATTSPVVIYTCPAGINAVVDSIWITNDSANNREYSMFVDQAGATNDETTAIAWEVDINNNSSEIYGNDEPIYLQAGATIAVEADQATAVNFTVYGRENKY